MKIFFEFPQKIVEIYFRIFEFDEKFRKIENDQIKSEK